VQVNVDAAGLNIPRDAANEPSLAVDPTATNRMVIGWRQFDSITSNFREAGVGFTRDGGRSWTFPGVLENGVFRSDPVLEFDSRGRVHYSSLAVPGGVILTDFFTSDDSGRSWSAPLPAFGGDKQWFSIDRSSDGPSGHLYQVWSLEENLWGDRVLTRSTDGGGSFEPPLAVQPVPTWGSTAIGPNGELYVVGNASLDLGRIVLQRSLDAVDPAVAVPTFELFEVPLGGAQPVGDGTTATPNPVGLTGQVWIAVDLSASERRGTLYVVSTVDPPGPDPADVHFVRSSDGGASWSAPLTLHPDDDRRWQWFATMAASPDGRLDVVWVESLDAANPAVGELRFTQSFDGGTSWSEPVTVTPAFDSHLGWPRQKKMGDYYHLRSDRVGADLAYAATFNGEQDVYYLRLGERDCDGNGIGDAADIAAGTLRDCDHNAIPDHCDVRARPELDGSGDGIPDSCHAPRRGGRRVTP
jgi:hypothetical protein